MQVVEFQSQLNPEQTLTVPPEVAALLAGQQQVRVLVLFPENSEDREWERLTAEEFLPGYSDSDAIYDQLPVG